MYAVVVKIQIKPDLTEVFMPLMRKNAGVSLEKEPGCRVFDIWRKDNEVLLYEIYDNEQSFHDHLASDHFAEFDEAVAAMILQKDVQCYEEDEQ